MGSLDTYWAIYSNLILSLGTNSLIALSIWLTLACGMLSIANAAFIGIGAYTSGILTVTYGTPFALALVAGALTPALVAIVLGRPVLKLSGVYLAMATLAFGEVIRILIINTESITGGSLGLNGIPPYTKWWHIALALVLAVAALWRLKVSKIGRAFEAIKEDETAAAMMGINVAGHKLFAFVLGAALAGLAGALNAHLTFFVSPGEFGFDRGVEILTMAVFGGIEGLAGPIIGASILTLLPEVLRPLSDYRLVVNGVILILVVLFLPKGVWRPSIMQKMYVLRRGPRS